MQANTPASASLLQATIRQVAPQILESDNVGRTGDTRDLYYLLDYLCFAVDRAYPEIPCAKGCSHCCHNQLFRVSEAEWATARDGLLALPEATRLAILDQAKAMYAAHRADLEAMAQAWTHGTATPVEAVQRAPKSCPALIAGRCSIYADRPGICRGYGYFSANVAESASLLICKQEGPAWIRALEESGVDQLPMPNWNPVQRRLEAISGPGGAIKPLPLWLLEMAESA